MGRQDLTADVDFRALDLHGEALGLECVLFASLAAFLRGMGGLEEARASWGSRDRLSGQRHGRHGPSGAAG